MTALRPFVSHPRRAAAALAALAGCKGEDKTPPRPPTPVAVAAAVTGSVPITLAANGTVEPTQTVDVQPQTSGPIIAVRFREGDEVRAGQVLFELDPRPARAALAQAQAVLARDRATASATRSDAERYARLVGQGYVTQSQADQQRAAAAASGATIAADEAAVQAARLELSYTTIRAPISGKTGTLNVRLGNQVRAPNPVPLVTINAVTPVLVRFPVPDRVLAELRAAQAAGRRITATATGPAVAGATERGEVRFIDNAVDTVSGSVTVKAQFANADRRLWPGAFVPLTLTLGETPDAVLVPSVAVQQGPQGPYVFAPDAKGNARQVQIKVDRTVGELTVVADGLRAGDRVVVDGQSRLFPGAPMRIARTLPTRPGAASGTAPQVAGGNTTAGGSNAPGTPGGTSADAIGGGVAAASAASGSNAAASANAAANAGSNRTATPGAAPAGARGASATTAPAPASGNN